jgi:hypothetical protein
MQERMPMNTTPTNLNSDPGKIPVSRRRGRGQLLLLLALVFGPMLLATAMYYGNFWVPQERSYHGELYARGETLANLGVSVAPERSWQLLVSSAQDCNQECQHLVYLARQIHIGLNRDASRADHALAVSEALPVELADKLAREYPQLQRYQLDVETYTRLVPEGSGAQLWIVDPHGNLVLRYPGGVNGKHVLEDLRRLLKLSNIG